MISSEMPELLGVCDRIFVMRLGRRAGDFGVDEATHEQIIAAITGLGLSAKAGSNGGENA